MIFQTILLANLALVTPYPRIPTPFSYANATVDHIQFKYWDKSILSIDCLDKLVERKSICMSLITDWKKSHAIFIHCEPGLLQWHCWSYEIK